MLLTIISPSLQRCLTRWALAVWLFASCAPLVSQLLAADVDRTAWLADICFSVPPADATPEEGPSSMFACPYCIVQHYACALLPFFFDSTAFASQRTLASERLRNQCTLIWLAYSVPLSRAPPTTE